MMKLYDITQELFHGRVYPGDLVPSYDRVSDMTNGDVYNLTNLSMGAHNATHVDAPFHFYENGKTIERLDLIRCIGPCSVIELDSCGEEVLRKKLEACQKRLLVKGNTEITLEMARVFNEYGILLVGVESQSVGAEQAPMPVHLELLGREVVLLEGICLEEVAPGDYFLFAPPIKLGGCDGAPCRAVLMELPSLIRKVSKCI